MRFILVAAVTASFVSGCKRPASTNDVAEVKAASGSAPAPLAELPPDYDGQSACAKQALLWQHVNETVYLYNALPPVPIPGPSFGKMLLGGYTGTTFSWQKDEIPAGREKLIHAVGSVAQAEFVPLDAAAQTARGSFTGIFKGASCALVRLSLATNPWKHATAHLPSGFTPGFTPGIAIKFLRNGMTSANIMAMNSTSGQGTDTNFFAREFSNQIPPAGALLKPFELAFHQVKRDPDHLPLTHLAAATEDGTQEPEPRAPHRIVLRPTPEVQRQFLQRDPKGDFRIALGGIDAGTVLYDVFAAVNAGDDASIPIGQLRLKSRLVPSRWGDEKLFFAHYKEPND